jgi:outer membrane lipoprotein-sorting protein
MKIFRTIAILFIINYIAIIPVYAVYDELLLKNYLKSLKSVAIDFEQILEDESAKGMLLIKKPHNFRCNYFSGSDLLIVGNRKFISIYDYNLNELSNIDRKDNMLHFIILNDEDIEKLNITQIIDYNDSVEFLSTDSEKNELSIILSKSPLKLEQISFSGLNQKQLIIQFGKIVEIENFNQSLFSIKNPKIFGPPSQLSLEALTKNFDMKL